MALKLPAFAASMYKSKSVDFDFSISFARKYRILGLSWLGKSFSSSSTYSKSETIIHIDK
jgi:hypothetical protein